MLYSFPPDFLWGVSTSAHQFEGFSTDNQWHDWELTGHIRSGDSCNLACDWWGSVEADLDRCEWLELNAIRLSLDWGRLQPYEGAWNSEAFDRYRSIILSATRRGLRPFITLHHFTHPKWFERSGAFLSSESVGRFQTLCDKVQVELGDLCSDWITFNEPNVYSVFGYLFGEFPPGKRLSIQECATSLVNMHRAHARAYELIHKRRPDARVGIATNWVDFYPNSRSPSDRLLAATYDNLFNRSSLDLLRNGTLQFPFSAVAPSSPDVIGLIDFIGLNVYNRFHVRTPWDEKSRATGGLFVPPHVPQGDCGMDFPYGEAFPPAITHAAQAYSQLNVPLYITENGVPDREDRIRPWLLTESIRTVRKAISKGTDVRGYFHWSLVDNFEWCEGWKLRFGLFALDEITQVRSKRFSADLYREIVKANGLTDEQISRFSVLPVAGDSRHR